MHELDTVLELLRFAPEGRCCSSFVFRNLNGREYRAVHSLKGEEVPPESELDTATFISQFRFFASVIAV
jgi:hypothetical protein